MARVASIVGAGITAIGLVVMASARAETAGTTDRRDPFWPVGYRPAPPVPTNVPPPVVAVEPPPAEPMKMDPVFIQKMAAELQAKIRSQIKVTGFMKSAGGQQLATVNGAIVAEGDRLDVAVDGQNYRFRVTGISVSAVNLEPVN